MIQPQLPVSKVFWENELEPCSDNVLNFFLIFVHIERTLNRQIFNENVKALLKINAMTIDTTELTINVLYQ